VAAIAWVAGFEFIDSLLKNQKVGYSTSSQESRNLFHANLDALLQAALATTFSLSSAF